MIDLGIVLGAGIVLGILLGDLGDAWYLVLLALEVSYFFICEATFGYTYGKYHQGLRVIKPDGDPPGTNSIAARNVIRLIEEPILALVIMVCSGGRRQRLGDLIGTTAVGSVVYSDPPDRSAGIYIYPVLWIVGAIALGSFVVSPHEDYMRQVNTVCRQHTSRILAVSQPSFPVLVRANADHQAAQEALDAPSTDEGLKNAIVSTLEAANAPGVEALQANKRHRLTVPQARAYMSRYEASWAAAAPRLHSLGVTCRFS